MDIQAAEESHVEIQAKANRFLDLQKPVRTGPCPQVASKVVAMTMALGTSEALGVPTVYVSLGTTHPKIVQATQAWLDVFALQPEACYGRSLSVLAGPDTQWQRMKDVVDSARSGQATTTRVVLYTTAGKKALYAVSALPTLAEGQMPVARLSMRRTDAIPCKVAASEDGQCSLMVKAERPFRISCVSEVFEHRFGIRASGVNRTVGVLHGPQTNLVVWQALFNAALSGRSSQGAVSVYTGDGAVVTGEICFTPVLGRDDIEFVRVTIEEEEEVKCASRSPRNVETSGADNFTMPRHSTRGGHGCTPSRQRKTSPVSVRSVVPAPSASMASVKELIAIRTRRRLQQEENSRREAEEQPAVVDTSGFLAFFLSLLMVVLVRCNLASSTPRTRRECRGTSSAYINSWKHVHGIGILGDMSEGDLDFYTPY